MDESLLLWINQSWQHPMLDVFFEWVSAKNSFSFPLLLIILVFLGLRFKQPGWYLGLSLILVAASGDLVGNILKSLFAQARPCLDYWEVIRMPHAETTRCLQSTSGMPSNHALNFFATFTFLSFFVRNHRITLTSIVLCLFVALSRVYLGEHFPSQVLSGAIIGIIYGLSIALIFNKFFKEQLNLYQNQSVGI